jgi:hypothetical protein
MSVAENTYETCPIKRPRRTKAEIDNIKTAIKTILKADHPMTVRQVFYQMVVRNVIEKTEDQYQGKAPDVSGALFSARRFIRSPRRPATGRKVGC